MQYSIKRVLAAILVLLGHAAITGAAYGVLSTNVWIVFAGLVTASSAYPAGFRLHDQANEEVLAALQETS